MSDSETPQHDPEPDGAAETSETPEAATPDALGGPLEQPDQSLAPLGAQLENIEDGAGSMTSTASPSEGEEDAKQTDGRHRGVWAGVAVLCAAAGIAGSLIGAHAIARTDATKARVAFHQSSAQIASTLKLAIQHEQDLAFSASTYFAANPMSSRAEFNTWAKGVVALHRYPEFEKLGLVALVPEPELAAFEARLAGRPLKSRTAHTTSSNATQAAASYGTQVSSSGELQAASSETSPEEAPTTSTGEAQPTPTDTALLAASATPTATTDDLRIVPPGSRPYYCLAVAELATSPAHRSPAGTDYCAKSPALLATRASGKSSYALVSVGGARALGIQTPVYRGGSVPHTSAARTSAFVGWLHAVLAPKVVLEQGLQGHPGYAALLRHGAGSSRLVFVSGTPESGGQRTTINLHNGWTVTSFGPSVNASVLADWHALALLIAGALASVLLGLLVFVLGSGGAVTAAPALAAPLPMLPHEDLYDPLTGLPNRALMMDRADRMLARVGRQSGLVAGALFIDIDWFKEVNEKLGQAAGDQLLTIVAQRLEGVVRQGDTVGRLEGDEFVVLVESAARGVRLDSLARRVIEALHKPVELDNFGPSFYLTASIGVAFGRYANPDELLRDAHLAAKAAGKDRYTLFNANMGSVIEGRSVLEVELDAALQEKQFFLLYEPIYDLSSRRVLGLEAVIRWQHPKQGIMVPADFIPLAEETGLIVPIGRWILEEACTRAAAWHVAGHRVGVSVAVSASQLNRDGFATDVRRALQQSGVEPSLITLEVSETTVMRDVPAAAMRLEEIKRLGVRIAIGDFGSGYTSHSELQRIPLDALKVDRSALAAADTEDYRTWLMETILVLGRDLSLAVIAKGVETQEQMEALQAMGFKIAQGAVLSEPVAFDAVESLFGSAPPTAPVPPTVQFQ